MSDHVAESVIVLPGTLNEVITTCSGCGSSLILPARQVRLICPDCGMVGRLDSSGRNLLSTHWNCPKCKAENPEIANFCLTCGTGLGMVCHTCEMLIYGAVCPHCGAHQARRMHYSAQRAERRAWEPLLRERAQADPYPAAEALASSTTGERPPPSSTEPRSSSQPVQPPTPVRGRRRGWWRWGRGPWGGWWMIVAAYFMFQRLINPTVEQISGFLHTLSLPGTTSGASVPVIDMTSGWLGIEQWLASPSLAAVPVPAHSDVLYVFLFAATLVGIAALPLLLFMVQRIIRRVFQ